ncbi:MAG: type II toxin-antitoxin system HicA family toxin [Deltaproteobacteria bacterium]|nr:type II toxin-antitoxin system HicA family toxin [Deltaproteobacteria bacterium]
MHRIGPCSRDELIRKLKSLSFIGPFSGGRHSYMKREHYRLTIHNPHGKQISSQFIKELLKQANISPEDWLNV